MCIGITLAVLPACGRRQAPPPDPAAATKFGAVARMRCRGVGADARAKQERAMRAIGRFGQLLGLGIPVFAVVLQLGGRLRPSQMLVMLVAAVCAFWIGRILEGYARS